MTRTVARLGALLMIAAGVASLVPSATARAATHGVTITDFAFAPQTLTIAVGDTVTWTNEDPVAHTATSTSGAFDSGEIDTGESYSLTFSSPGTYEYLCTPHPTMTGTIVVEAVPVAAPTPAPSGGLPNVALAPPDDRGPAWLASLGLMAAGAILAMWSLRRRKAS